MCCGMFLGLGRVLAVVGVGPPRTRPPRPSTRGPAKSGRGSGSIDRVTSVTYVARKAWKRFHADRGDRTREGGWWSRSPTSRRTPAWVPARCPGCSTAAPGSASRTRARGCSPPSSVLDYRPNPLARGLSPGAVPDPRGRRPVLHPRLGRRAPPRRRRPPSTAAATTSCCSTSSRRSTATSTSPPSPGATGPTACSSCRCRRRPPACAGSPTAGRARRCCSTPAAPASPPSSPTTSTAGASPPATSSTSGTSASRSSATIPTTRSGSSSGAEPRAGLPRDDGRGRARRRRPALVRHGPHVRGGGPPARRTSCCPAATAHRDVRRRPTPRPSGVLEAARAAGLDVPGDLSVVGFDDVEVSGYAGLTTVRQPLFESGRLGGPAAARGARGDGAPARPSRTGSTLELVVRSTTAPPADATARAR